MLEEHTVYYWRVDQITDSNVVEGDVWRFRTTGTGSIGGPPRISITSPSDGQMFPPGSDIEIIADVSDSTGTIDRVEFYQYSTLLGTVTNPPYSFTWSDVAIGTYQLTARATDSNGDVAVSAIVTVVVTGRPVR
jgi:chitinase